MNKPARLDEKLLRRRKAMVTGMVVLTATVLLGFIFGSWHYVNRIGNYLEDELGKRLLSVARLTAELIETGVFPIEYTLQSDRLPEARIEVSEMLTTVDLDNQLQGAFLVDRNYHVIASSRQLFAPGDRLTFLEEDSVVFRLALAGAPSATDMQIIAGNRFKNAYAPVYGPLDEAFGIIVIQANASFFQLIRDFQGGLILGGVVSVGLAILFSIFLFWAISLLIRTHESLRQTERLAAMGQMAATVAHEIRNPLGIIKGTADVLKSKYGRESDDELFEFIPNEVRRLNRLVSDFLTFARDRELEKGDTDLKATAEKTLKKLEDEIKQANVVLSTEFEDIPDVLHDRDGMEQILLNLTLNSIQSMNGGGKLFVRLKNRTNRGRKYVGMEVEDTGGGFERNPDELFEPFFTTKTSGSGLGLAICKRIVEKHGGWIEAESAKGKGTVMRVFLPLGE